MSSLQGSKEWRAARRAAFVIAALAYLAGYGAARDAHWIVHAVSYSWGSGERPEVAGHAVHGGDYTVLTSLFYRPLALVERTFWYLAEPPGSAYVGPYGPPPTTKPLDPQPQATGQPRSNQPNQ